MAAEASLHDQLSSETGTAESIPGWYARTIADNDEQPLIAACPDHYLSRGDRNGTQEVIETTGGVCRCGCSSTNSDTASITTPVDTGSTQWVSVARAANGTAIGGIRHQFRDDADDGFHVRLTVEFPATTPPHMLAAHRWHLACEFSTDRVRQRNALTAVRAPRQGSRVHGTLAQVQRRCPAAAFRRKRE